MFKTIGIKALKALGLLFAPISKNPAFFVFMFAVGYLCTQLEVPDIKGAEPYAFSAPELFFDLYLLGAILAIIPTAISRWIKRLLCVFLYTIAIIDVYCFTTFGSTITPTMLLLVGETNGREASEFISQYLSLDILAGGVGYVLLILFVHIGWALAWKYRQRLAQRLGIRCMLRLHPMCEMGTKALLGLLCLIQFVSSYQQCTPNKEAIHRLLSYKSVSDVEHDLTRADHAMLYLPVYRLIFSIYANQLAAKQIDKLIAATDNIRIDSCSHRSSNIVFIIGESFGRHHSQQYGYFMPNTPRQIEREKSGMLVKFSDVVAPWNLTSFVFKNVFSMHVVGQKGEWCDYPLFPELFRKAGYHVSFITNQFLPKAKEEVYDFSGGFFLNNPVLDKAQFDTRNTELHQFDNGLLSDYDKLKSKMPQKNNLIIFHLIGQHVRYNQRYPKVQRHFTYKDYQKYRPELNDRQRQMIAYYDNAVLYNDSIVDEIIKRFEKEDAIIVYMPDHGEECYEGTRNIVCRNHSAAIDYDLAKYEFEIPFWIYCSPKYIQKHKDIYKRIYRAKDKPLMTDVLPHTLLYLAGIHTPYYQDENNVLSERYNIHRPRILKGTTDYNKLKKQ